jgi:hypothetical protein
MPLFVITVIASPSVQANRFGLAETHCGGRRRVIARATTPVGLYRNPAATRTRNSRKNREATNWSSTYCMLKYA